MSKSPVPTRHRDHPEHSESADRMAGRADSRRGGSVRAAGVYLAPLLALFAILNAADLVSTYVGLANGMREGNPLMSTLLTHYGFGALIAYKMAVVLAVAAGIHLLRAFHLTIAHVTIWVCNALVFGVVLLNIIQFTLFT